MAAAFNHNTYNNLQSNIRQLHYRRKLVGKLVLTNEEYLQTFVPAEVRVLFREVTPWVTTERYNHRFELHLPNVKLKAMLHMSEDKGHTAPVPRDLRVQPDAPPEIIERITNWATLGGDVSREFGRVSNVLDILNKNFSRVAIRYYWPTILAICSEGTYTKDLVQEMQELRKPVKLKPLPPGLSKAMRQAAETIATARLIPADVEDKDPNAGEVLIDIESGQHYTEEFGSFHGLQ